MDLRESVAKKLMVMKRCVDFLRAKQAVGPERLDQDYGLRSAVERNFQVAIEAAIDIAEAIIVEEGLQRPEDYRGAILILGRKGVIPPEFAGEFAPAAGFRNILVHGYAEIEVQKLHEFLLRGLDDFDTFARHVTEYLRARQPT